MIRPKCASGGVCVCGVRCVHLCLSGMSCPTLCDPMDCSPPGSLTVHGSFTGKNAGVGCHFLLQGIFLTQGSNMHLLHLQR